MKIKKSISWILSIVIACSMMDAPIMGYANGDDSLEHVVVLFEDDFENYVDGISFYGDSSYGKYYDDQLADEFRLFAGLAGNSATTTKAGYSSASTPADIAQIATETESGIGTGNSLKVTAQVQAKANQLVRLSGISESTIADKKLVFETTFTVPEFVGFADGLGLYLAPNQANVTPISNSTSLHLSNATTDKAGELMYLGARSSQSDWSAHYGELGNGTVCNELWTFGEKVADLTPGETYTYKVTMTPDELTGSYVVKTDLNGTKLTLGQSEYSASSTIPTVEEMSGFTTIKMMRLVHEWYFSVGYCDNDFVNKIGTTNLGITDADGNYDNDRVVAYFDDMSMMAEEISAEDPDEPGTDPDEPGTDPDEPGINYIEYFSDDFETYTTIAGSLGYGLKDPSNYESDIFKYFCAKTTEPSNTDEATQYFGMTVGDPASVSLIESGTGVGSGKALKITGQPRVSQYTMLKRSNITSENSLNKQIIFETTFQAPNPMTMGEGFGVWTFADASSTEIFYVSDNTDILKGLGTPLRNELLYVSSRTKAPSSVKVYAFGEEVAIVDHNTVYNYKLILTPTENGRYTAVVNLNGVSKTLVGTNVPSQAEFGTYNRVHVSPITHEWCVWEQGFQRSYANVPDNVKGSDGLYEIGRTLGIIDNLSLKGCDIFEIESIEGLNSYSEIALSMKEVTIQMTGNISSIDTSKITIDNGATVSAVVDETDSTKLKLTFGNLVAAKKYKISMAGIINIVGIEFKGEVELTSSNGLDVMPIELNGSHDGTIDRTNPNTIEVNVNKDASVTNSSSIKVLVFVDEEINGAYKNVRVYNASVTMNSSINTALIDNVIVGEDEIVRVFVWNSTTHMKPVTNVTIFN